MKKKKVDWKAISPLIGITIQKIKQLTQGMPITSVYSGMKLSNRAYSTGAGWGEKNKLRLFFFFFFFKIFGSKINIQKKKKTNLSFSCHLHILNKYHSVILKDFCEYIFCGNTFEKHCKGENWVLGVSPFNGLWTQQWSWILSQRFMCRTWNKNKIDFKRFFKAIISELKHITPEGMSLVTVTLRVVWMWSNISHCLSQFWFHIILTSKGNQNTCPSFWVIWSHHSVPQHHTQTEKVVGPWGKSRES